MELRLKHVIYLLTPWIANTMARSCAHPAKEQTVPEEHLVLDCNASPGKTGTWERAGRRPSQLALNSCAAEEETGGH